MARKIEGEGEGRILKATQIGEFTLLNSEKLSRVLDMLEGITDAVGDDAIALSACKSLPRDEAILALYDRLGGAIKMGERKIAMGAFYDFAAKAPRSKPKIEEEDFADEYVLTRKKTNKTKKAESVGDRIKRIERKAAPKSESEVKGADSGAKKAAKTNKTKKAEKKGEE